MIENYFANKFPRVKRYDIRQLINDVKMTLLTEKEVSIFNEINRGAWCSQEIAEDLGIDEFKVIRLHRTILDVIARDLRLIEEEMDACRLRSR